jgi:hypothetical protein
MVDGSALFGGPLVLISVDPRNPPFVIGRYFHVDIVDPIAVRYFGDGAHVCVWKELQVIGRSCFRATGVGKVIFETRPLLKRIEREVFSLGNELKSISIPADLEFIGGPAFTEFYCQNLPLSFDRCCRRFRVVQGCLVDDVDSIAVRYLRKIANLWDDFRFLGHRSFCGGSVKSF